MKIADILKGKGSHVMTVRPNETVENAAKRLSLESIGALIVSHDAQALDGVISERDIARGVSTYGASVAHKPVSDLMTTGVLTCTPEDNIADVARLMTKRRLRHLPVMDGARLVGIVSVGDILKHRLDEVEFEAHVMQDLAIGRR